MIPNIKQLQKFYASPLGKIAHKNLQKQIISLTGDVRAKRVLTIGFTTPYLDFILKDAERIINIFPPQMGAFAWPKNSPSKSVLSDLLELPLNDASIDIIIAVHAFEYVADSEELMREIWRIAAPNASLIVVVPRRHGLWAQRDNTPFGSGHPFSKSQLDSLLRIHSFIPKTCSDALFLLPSNSPFWLKLSPILEKVFRLFGGTFAGAMCVKAKKQLFPAVPRRKKHQRLVKIPALKPQTAFELPKKQS